MKKRIIICLLCLIMLFSNITPAISFKAYAADEYVEDEIFFEEDNSFASVDYAGDSDDVIIFEEDSFANSSYTGSDSGEPQFLETDAAAESGSSGEEAFENGKPVFYDVNIFHYSDSPEDPDDATITEAEYLAGLEKDKNSNGILDILEEDEDEVHAAAIETGILGDLNGDELVDNKDVVLLYRHVAGWNQDINNSILDFNGDGYVNNSDANHLLKYVSGWPDTVLYKGKKHDIIYHLTVEGSYLKEADVINPNPNYYYSSDGLTLKNVQANGYIFEGWFDGEGESAERVRKINVGETGEIELYARWTPRTYEIQFDSEYVEVATKYYTIETGATLTNPALTNYAFVGWTNQENGQLVKNVPKGSFGNVTLVANWAARRSLAKPVQQLGDPLIIEDSENGKLLFVYELGAIENIPLFTLYRFTTAQGITSSVSYTEQTSISESDARTISETVGQATTDSATWTLSEGWNDSTSVSEAYLNETGLTREEAEARAKSSSNTYRMDTTVGESSVIVDSSQFAYRGAKSRGTETGVSVDVGENTKYTVDAGVEITNSVGAEIGIPEVGKITPSTSVKGHLDVGGEWSRSVDVGATRSDSWNKTLELSGQHAHTNTTSKSWNQTTGYSNSESVSNTRSVSQAVSELISEEYEYGSTYSRNGEHSSGKEFSTQNSNENSYSNTVAYDKSTLCEKKIEFTHTGTVDGYYRLVLAGTAHVFGIVGYDVATCSYFTYTFSVMDDETYEFLDYSKFTPNFDDNEIGVLPFEIPVFVNEYVNAKIARSQGLEINIGTGMVTGYTGEDPIVVVPSYVDVNNGDGTYTSVKITGFTSDAFRNNTSIEGIMFGEYVTSIPDSAFEGCTSLRDVYFDRLEHVGNRAFFGCTSLSALTIPDTVTSLGDDAFYNVNEVKITAANKNVALAAVNSGVKNLVLNISDINAEMADTVLEAPAAMQVFEVQGGRLQYNELQIISQANATRINGINFVNNTEIPLRLASSSVDLNQTSVSSSRYCMIISSANCDLTLFGTNQMTASKGDAIVCGNVTLGNSDQSVQASLQVSGNIYKCGNISNANRYLNHISGEIIDITPEQFANLEGFIKVLPTSVSIAGPRTLNVGASVSLTAAVGPDNAYDQTVTWSSSNPNVAAVNSEGIVTGIGVGTATITATANGSSDVSASLTVTVRQPFTLRFNLNISNSSAVLNGEASRIAYVAEALDGLPVPSCNYYNFDGWFTAPSGGELIGNGSAIWSAGSEVTLYAHWTLPAFTVSWSNGTGYSISVYRTSSPNPSASTGYLSSGATVYNGDALSISYNASTGYSISSHGSTSITVSGNVTSSSIYASATPNYYTYTIVCRSTNGTELGNTTATYQYGTTNTIYPPEKSGYTSPAAQSVAWDSTSGKTITFIYTPIGAEASQTLFTGTWWKSSESSSNISYKVYGEWQNRTSTSVQVRIKWVQTISGGYYGYTQKFYASFWNGGNNIGNTGEKTIASSSTWPSTNRPNNGSKTVYSDWITVPLTPTETSITVECDYSDANKGTRSMTPNSFTVPAY